MAERPRQGIQDNVSSLSRARIAHPSNLLRRIQRENATSATRRSRLSVRVPFVPGKLLKREWNCIFHKYAFLLRGTWFQSNKAGSLLTKHREKYGNANRKDENLVMQAGVKQERNKPLEAIDKSSRPRILKNAPVATRNLNSP